MKTRILASLFLGSLALLLTLSLSSPGRSAQYGSSLASPETLRTDHNSPVLPLLQSLLIADGGGPAPPLPPSSVASLPSSIPQSTLLADGGGPAPPLPPVFQADSAA